LVPTDAHVIRDWTYDGPLQEYSGLDLSDHYPVIAEFDVKAESSEPDDPDEDDPDDTGGSGSSGCWVNTLKPGK